MERKMKKILLLLVLAAVLPLSAQKIMLKKGPPIDVKDMISKDQYGILVNAGKDKETGDPLCRFIPFVQVSPASLMLFPFCDVKAVERIDSAVHDRIDLIRKKFADRYPDYEGTQDFSMKMTIHTGVHSYKILFTATESLSNGMIGYLYSDSADTLFYGKIFLHGLVGKSNSAWVGTIYPTERKLTHKGSTYTVFTVIAPPKKDYTMTEEEEQKETQKRRRGGRRPPAGGGHPNGNVPPPGR